MKIKDNSLLRSQCYINGEWLDADSGKTVDVTNPATGEVICAVPYMGEAETRRAIEGAEGAFHAWKTRPAKERSVILERLVKAGNSQAMGMLAGIRRRW